MTDAVWFWIAYVACGLLCVLLAYLGSRRRRLRPIDMERDTRAVECAVCGYDVRGLPGHVCPECGADLSEVGRVTPQFRRWQKAPPLARAIIWTLFIGAAATCAVGMAMLNYLPLRLGVDSVERMWNPQGEMSDANRRLYEIEHHLAAIAPMLTDAGNSSFDDFRMGRIPPEQDVGVLRIHRVQPGSQQQSGKHTGISLIYDGITGDWQLRNGEKIVSQGNGLPSPAVALRFVQLGRAESSATRPPGAPTTNSISAAKRDRLEAAAIYLRFLAPLTWSPEEGGPNGSFADLPASWRADVPMEAFFPTYHTQPRGLNPLVLGSGGDGVTTWPAWRWMLPAAGLWLAVWACGLWLVTRRRSVRPRRHVADDAPASGE